MTRKRKLNKKQKNRQQLDKFMWKKGDVKPIEKGEKGSVLRTSPAAERER